MSKIKSFALVLLVAVSLTSCNDKSKTLARTWKVEDFKLNKPIPPQAQAFFQSFLQQMKDNLRMTYKADGSYEVSMPGKTVKGKWVLSKDGKTINATDESGKTEVYYVQELTEKKFVYAKVQNTDTATFILVPGELIPAGTAPQQPAMPQGQPEAQGQPTDTAAK
jgi:hypothetical protein